MDGEHLGTEDDAAGRQELLAVRQAHVNGAGAGLGQQGGRAIEGREESGRRLGRRLEVVLRYADGQALHALLQRLAVVVHRLVGAGRVHRVVPGQHLQRNGRVLHAARQGPAVVQRPGQREHAVLGDAAVGGFQPHGAAPGGRYEDGAARAGAQGQPREARRDGRTRARRRSARNMGQIPGVAGGGKRQVGAGRANGEFVRGQLAQNDGAGIAQAPYRRGVFLGHIVQAQPGLAGGRQAGHVVDVLDGHRNAVEQRQVGAFGARHVCAAGRLHGAAGIDVGEGMDVDVHGADAAQRHAGQHLRGGLAGTQRAGHLPYGKFRTAAHGCSDGKWWCGCAMALPHAPVR